MFKKNSILIFIVLLLIQFALFIAIPFCFDGCNVANEIKSKFYTNILNVFAFITFILSLYKVIKEGPKTSIFFGVNIFYLLLSIFYFLYFVIVIYSVIFN
jgi:quinol-cytochrome oxidoreductase complex cytochrome b subunit